MKRTRITVEVESTEFSVGHKDVPQFIQDVTHAATKYGPYLISVKVEDAKESL